MKTTTKRDEHGEQHFPFPSPFISGVPDNHGVAETASNPLTTSERHAFLWPRSIDIVGEEDDLG